MLAVAAGMALFWLGSGRQLPLRRLNRIRNSKRGKAMEAVHTVVTWLVVPGSVVRCAVAAPRPVD